MSFCKVTQNPMLISVCQIGHYGSNLLGNTFHLFAFILLLLSAQLLVVAEVQAQEVQNVYEYKNTQGVTEFTDTIKSDKEPVKQTQIKKTTAEQEAQGKAQLQQIMEKDKELDKRLEKQRQLEREQNIRRPKEQADDSKESNTSDRDVIWGRRPYPPNRPGRPIGKPKPLPKPRPLPRR